MGKQADSFLSSFTRIEKWLKNQLGSPKNMSFVEMVRRLSKQNETEVKKYEDDLLQFAQLRNAIIHERISTNFVIAEPNEWTIQRIQKIEEKLIDPKKVYPMFKKKVISFCYQDSLLELLRVVNHKGYSQFPIYDHSEWKGLITVHGLGLWLASQVQKTTIDLKDKTIEDILLSDRRRKNYQFVHQNQLVFQVEKLFEEQPALEAVLITQNGTENKTLLGMIRPRDLHQTKNGVS